MGVSPLLSMPVAFQQAIKSPRWCWELIGEPESEIGGRRLPLLARTNGPSCSCFLASGLRMTSHAMALRSSLTCQVLGNSW